MATKKKPKKSKAADPKKMNADIAAKVEVKQLLKDERSHKIAGTILILIAILLFLSFTSYLFTWQEDQSKVFKGAKILLPSHAESMANLLGTAGAYFSDLVFPFGFWHCFLSVLHILFHCWRKFICAKENIFGRPQYSLCNCRSFGNKRFSFYSYLKVIRFHGVVLLVIWKINGYKI